jgi:predicted  nucleic acid-binding Zn-ribbon protein
MSTSRKRKCSNDDEEGNEMEQSSYAKMKLKLNNVQHELGQLRMELKETQHQKVEIEAALEKVRKEQHESNRNKRGSSKGGQSSYAKLKIELQDTHRIKVVCEDELVKVRRELQETQQRECEFESVVHLLRLELQELKMKNEEHIKEMEGEVKGLKRAMGLRWLHIENLKATITAGNISYDAMVARVEEFERTMEQQRIATYSSTRRNVCKAFGWSVTNVDAVLLRAACGFWDATTLDAEDNLRASLKKR